MIKNDSQLQFFFYFNVFILFNNIKSIYKGKIMNGIVRILAFSLIILLSASVLNAQKSKAKKVDSKNDAKHQVLATIGNEKITYADIEKAFKKNMNRRDLELYNISQDSLFDFIELYVNYRLKVQDALNRGFSQDSSII